MSILDKLDKIEDGAQEKSKHVVQFGGEYYVGFK